MVGPNLGQFFHDGRFIDVHSTEASQGFGSHLMLIFLDKKAGSFWKHQHPSDEDDSPGKLKGNRNAVAPGVHAILGSIVDDGCDQQSESNC